MTTEPCHRCGGLVAYEVDQSGPRLYCRICSWQQDLLAPPTEALAAMMKPELPSSRHSYFRDDGSYYTAFRAPGRPRKKGTYIHC